MKRLLHALCILPLLSGFFVLSVDGASAAVAIGCQYGSTQARVQRDINDSWKRDVTIARGQSFNVGGFHNATGQFGNDVVIQVVGPNLINFYGNGQQVWPPSAGQYTVYVNTRDQFGGGCSEQAHVNVVESAQPVQSAPVGLSCNYSSTQARVQKDINDPWKSSVVIQRGQSFNVGGFHNGTGQFANDVMLTVAGPGLNSNYTNGQQVVPPLAGQYYLIVQTLNQKGGGCQEVAYVTVVEPPQVCNYSSTEARVQQSTGQAWTQVIATTKGQGFNVGSFHNASGQFASDTQIKVYGSGLNGSNGIVSSNGAKISPPATGWYLVRVSTNNQNGTGCQQDAWVWVTN